MATFIVPLRRVAAARDVVKRGQEVWVKVVAMTGDRLTLSMRDVDQGSGQDLLPGARLGAEGINPSGPAGNTAASNSLRGLSGVQVSSELPSLVPKSSASTGMISC